MSDALTTIRVQYGDNCWEFTREEATVVCVELGKALGLVPDDDGEGGANGEELKLSDQ